LVAKLYYFAKEAENMLKISSVTDKDRNDKETR
jgi:hypothetical protein